MSTEQAISCALVEKTVPILQDLAYLVYLMEWANLHKN